MNALPCQFLREEVRIPSVAVGSARKEHLFPHLILKELRRATLLTNAVHREIHGRIRVLRAKSLLQVRVQALFPPDAQAKGVKPDMNFMESSRVSPVVLPPELREFASEVVIGNHRRLTSGSADDHPATFTVLNSIERNLHVPMVELCIRRDGNFF